MGKTKINWKKKYEDEYDRYWKLKENYWDTSDRISCFLLAMIGTCFLIFVILTLFGVFDSPIEKLGLDENELVREHILQYYPEFENCSIEYACIGSGFSCKNGIKIYCDSLDNRNDLKVKRNIEPTEVFYLDGITLEDILLTLWFEERKPII